ncbi:DinB family protein [Priestia aryabhattai]|uniref:DinB family protein n=1 Tax=Priestia aryabhattai TaxID=412384 RepID=UPI001C8E2C51|nr:DinB family protein [Priestia aryabhattai]MBY0213798.1 DinB family protein [Priestia aryabhattai]
MDLHLDNEMEPSVALLYATVSDTYERLKLLVNDVNQEELFFKGTENKMNSIGQLLSHLTVVDLHWVYRLKNQQIPSSLQKEYGPLVDAEGQIPSIKDTTIIDLIDSYDKVQAMFRLECTKLSEEGLNNVVSYENGKTATIRWGIWHIADHSRYHQAHIGVLKKLYKEK